MTGHNVARAGGMQHKNGATGRSRSLERPVAPRARRRVAGLRAPSGATPPIGASDVPGQPSDDGPMTNTTWRPAGWSSGRARRLAGAVTDVAQRSLPHPRHDTPTPGWESGVWVRIQHRRRKHRLGAFTLAVAAIAGAGLLLARPGASPSTPVRLATRPQTPLRADGSTPVPGRWRIDFDGAELRVYRNALGVVHRCPGDGCIRTARGGALELPVAAAGEYRAVVFSRPSAGNGRTLEEDLSVARARGDAVEMSAPLVAY